LEFGNVPYMLKLLQSCRLKLTLESFIKPRLVLGLILNRFSVNL